MSPVHREMADPSGGAAGAHISSHTLQWGSTTRHTGGSSSQYSKANSLKVLQINCRTFYYRMLFFFNLTAKARFPSRQRSAPRSC